MSKVNMASAEESQSILEDYKSSLNDLAFNSKPLINVLTMLAEENEAYADGIIKVIRDRVKSVGIKLKMPSLYLLDSILKNVGGDFINILSNYMVEIFTDVFDEGDEKIRMSLYKLRNTWPQYFPSKFLYELDLSVKELDPNWPVTDPPPSASSIHVNPKFLVQNEKKEKLAPSDESIHIANLKAKEKEEKLKAEERKIKEQLKKLQEEQLKLQQSRLEEERLKQEELLRKQQADRERLIKEQQKQLLSLRMQQEKDLRMKNLSTAITSVSPKKTVLPESKKNSDPRLAKREMAANAKEIITSKTSSSESNAVKLSPRKEVTSSHMQDLRETLTQRYQDRSSKSILPASPKTQKESQRLPLEGDIDTRKQTPSFPLDNRVSTSTNVINATVNKVQKELASEPQTIPDVAVDPKYSVEPKSIVEPKAVKRLVLNEVERLVVVVSDDRGDSNGNKQLSDASDSVDAPPIKKRKSDEPTRSIVLSMYAEEDDDQMAITASETTSDKATVEKPVEKDTENTSPTSCEIDPPNRFRKRNRSEWRKLMIEKAKLERRKRIPSEKELPREMRVEYHEELVNKLKSRLSSGEIKEEAYASLVKQLDLMYEVQRTRETPEKKKELTENQREKGSDTGNIKDRLGQAKDIGYSPSKVDKTDTAIQSTGKALSQKETNQDLIRQLREKRNNAEKEQIENEWRLKRDWNINQLKAGRDRRGRDRRDRDGDSRVRRGFENRTDRRDREYEPDVRDARDRRRNRERDRDRLINERADHSRSRFNRDRDNRERRQPSPSRDRRHNRLDESSYRRDGRNLESRSRPPVESNEKGDKKPADSAKGKQDEAEREKDAKEDAAPAVEVEQQKDKDKGLDDAVKERKDIELEAEVKEQPSKETDMASSSLENDNTDCKSENKDSVQENATLTDTKSDIVTSQASAPTEEEGRDNRIGDIEKDSHEDSSRTVINPKGKKPFSKEKKGIESFRIPKRERPEERSIEERPVSQKPYPVDLSRDVDDRSVNQLPVDLPLDNEIRMLSWRHQDGDSNPMDGRQHRFRRDRDVVPRQQRLDPRHDRRMFHPEERRGTPPFIDHDLEPGPDGHRSIPANERSLSWRERHEPGFRPGLHPDLDRRPGFVDVGPPPGEGPDFRPGFRDEDVDFPDRFPLRQGREGDHRKMSPMHQPDASMQLRPDVDDMYHPGPPVRGPRYREPQHHGPRFREPRFGGPRMAGPSSDFGHFQEPGYREIDEDRILRRDFRGPRFGPSDLPFEEMDRNLGPEGHSLPPNSHRHLEGPIERRPEYFDDREPSSIDYRHGLRESWRGDHPDSFRHSPFDENRMDKEDRHRFEERRQYPMEVDRPMPYQPGPPGNSEHLDPQQRRHFHPGQGGEGLRPMPHEYQERRPSPVIFDYAHNQGPPDQFMRASEPYSMPPSAGFTMTNPLMKMIESVKRSAGESTHVDQLQKPPQAPQSFIGVNELFHKLVSTGVIATQDAPDGPQKSATPPPRLETQEESIPEINFVMEDLKKRHLSIINTLYLGSQCSSCGLRYPEAEKQLYRDHLDWHFRVNRREKENKKSISRPWFYSVEQWCDMDDVFDNEEAAKSNVFENEAKREETLTVQTGDGSCSVLQGQDDSYCNICFDPFEQFWDEALEEWRYKDAVRIKRKTYHRNCYDDMESGLSENDEELQSEEEKFSPVAFSEFVKSERSQEIWKNEEESSVVSPERFGTISVKTEPEDVSMGDDDEPHNSVSNIDNDVTIKTEPNPPVTVKTEPEDVEMCEEANQRIPFGNSENNFNNRVSVKSEPIEPVTVKTEPVDSSIEDRQSATAVPLASEKDTEKSSFTKEPSDLVDPPVEKEHQTPGSASDTATVLQEQAGDVREKDNTASDSEPGGIKVTSENASEDTIVKGKEDLLPGSDAVDEANRTVTITETKSVTTQDVVMDTAVSGNAGERIAACALECSDTLAILNTDRKTEDASVCGTEKAEIGESSAEIVKNNASSAQEDAKKDLDPKKHSEQLQAKNIDEIILEPVTENMEIKNSDEIIESEGKPQG